MTLAKIKFKSEIFLFIFGFLVLYGLIFYPVLMLPYAFHDEFKLWSYNSRENIYGYPELYQAAAIGRVLGGYFSAFQAYFIHSVEDIGLLRLTSVIALVFSATGYAIALQKLKVDRFLAFLISAGIFLVPGLRDMVDWGWSTPTPIAACITILAGLILPLDKENPSEATIIYLSKTDLARISIALALIIIAMFFYPPSAMLFLLFPSARILFTINSLKNWQRILGFAFVELGVFVVACGAYFGLNRWIIVPYYRNRPEAMEFLNNHPSYNFRLMSFNQIFEKALLFKRLTIQSLDFFFYDFNFSLGVSATVFAVICGCLCYALLNSLKKSNVDEVSPNCILTILGMVLGLSLMINAPTLLAAGTHNPPPSHTHIAYSSFIFLLFSWAIFFFAGIVNADKQACIARTFIILVIAILGFVSQHNGLRFAFLASSELKYMEAKIAPHIGDNTKIHVIRPRWVAPLAWYYPTSYHHFIIPVMVRSIFVKLGKEALFHPENITCGYPLEPHEKAIYPTDLQIITSKNLKDCNHWVDPASAPIIVDMNLFTESFQQPIPGSPLPVTPLKISYYGFDVISIDTTLTPHSRNSFYAVSSGEYDFGSKSCPLGGCTKVFSGPTLESVIEWIDHEGRFNEGIKAKVLTSSRSQPVSNLLGLSGGATTWTSNSPPQYPEWIVVEYQTPQSVKRLRLLPTKADTCDRSVRMKAPRDFIFQGSQNGEQWSDIYTVKGASFSKDCSWVSWDFPGTVSHKYYRVYITANNGDPGQVSLQRVELVITGPRPAN